MSDVIGRKIYIEGVMLYEIMNVENWKCPKIKVFYLLA